VDERKSWKWIIAAYGGGVALIALVTVFITRGAGHREVVIGGAFATATPTVADVYSGIRPDAQSPLIHAKAPKPSEPPSPVPSATAATQASAAPAPAAKGPAKAAKRAQKLRAGADDFQGSEAMVASRIGAEPASAPPVETQQVPAATEAPAAPTAAAAAPTDAPVPAATVAPAAAPTAAPAQDVPIYAPQRIVDAQVRVAVQPDYPDVERERGEKGTSVVLVTIDPKGNVVSASISSSSGYAALDRAAVAAARSSQFVAPKINGHPATETYRLVYDFSP